MKKEILILTGSPRKNGNSERMAGALRCGAEAAGHHVTLIRTADLNVKGCVACGRCYQSAEHPCCHEDDFNGIVPLIERAEIVVFAAPLYWSTFPAPIKRVIDNFYCFYGGNRDVSGKRAALLSCGEDTAYNMFDGIQRAYELILPVLGWSNAGMIFAPGVNQPDDVEKTDVLKRCRALGGAF